MPYKDKIIDASLSYDQVQSLVAANNNSTYATPSAPAGYTPPGVPNEVVICIAWTESSFDPNASNPSSSALGLMQITSPSVDDVNNNTPVGVHFNYPADMTDPGKNIACGTYLLALKIQRENGDVRQAIADYGTGLAYADQILTCSSCLQSTPANQDCLNAISLGLH